MNVRTISFEWSRESELLERTFVVSATAPLTTRTKSLSRYLGTSSAKSELTAGVDSAGFSKAQLPAAIAPA